MGHLINLPNGQSAELRAPEDVSERLRRPFSRALRGIRPDIMQRVTASADLEDGDEKSAVLRQLQFDMTNEESDAFTEAQDLAIVALVAKWSFSQEITLEGVLDLPGRSLDVLRAAVAPQVNAMFVDASPDPKNPTAPGGGSNGSGTPSAGVLQIVSPTSGGHTA